MLLLAQTGFQIFMSVFYFLLWFCGLVTPDSDASIFPRSLEQCNFLVCFVEDLQA